MNNIFYLFFLLIFTFCSRQTLAQNSFTLTYSDGDIPTSLAGYDPSCNGPNSTLSFTLPAGENYEITGIDVSYDFQSVGANIPFLQRSLIFCQNLLEGEPEQQGISSTAGAVESYSRTGVNIANGMYDGGTEIIFEMHAWRTIGGAGCNTSAQFIPNNTWTITIHYSNEIATPKVGVNETAPAAMLDVNGKIKIGDDNIAVSEGNIRFNTERSDFEGYNGDQWFSLTKESNNDIPVMTQVDSSNLMTYLFGTHTSVNDSMGFIYDSGGPNGNYGNNENHSIVVNIPSGAENVIGLKLSIEDFELETGNDFFKVLGMEYSGSQAPFSIVLPPANTILNFESDFNTTLSGLKLTYQWLFSAMNTTPTENAFGPWNFNTEKMATFGGVQLPLNLDPDSLGLYSLQYGVDTRATGDISTSIGKETEASGDHAAALGHLTKATGENALAAGRSSSASGFSSTAMGLGTNASAAASTSMGNLTTASGYGTFSTGNYSLASGFAAFAAGNGTTASGDHSTALGASSTASGENSTAMGDASEANAESATAMGRQTLASGNFSTALGNGTIASGEGALASGSNTTASGLNSVALGVGTLASKSGASALGSNTTASEKSSTALGNYTTASGIAATAMGNGSLASGTNSTAMGFNTTASGENSTAMGKNTQAIGAYATAIGEDAEANASTSTAFGRQTLASGSASTAMGKETIASGSTSTAMGSGTSASGTISTAMGSGSDASGFQSTAIGSGANASNTYSIAMGRVTTASGISSTAMGSRTISSGDYSTAMGDASRATGDNSTAIGNGSDAIGENSLATGFETEANALSAAAFGSQTLASGAYSIAMGSLTTATKLASTAMGSSTDATADYSTAMGLNSQASGIASTAMGGGTAASGNYSTALGNGTTASGNYTTAMGRNTIASGLTATAIGFSATASGDYSIAMGRTVDTKSYLGAMILGDGRSISSTAANSNNSADNQLKCRFTEYQFYTGAGTSTIGVQLKENDTAWSSISDRNKKENFSVVDGQEVLNKLATIELTSWNYKGIDPKVNRHYGIMAQDFFQAFGQDEYGTIGCDTLVNPIDLLGVAYVAIQALDENRRNLEEENRLLNQKLTDLESMLKSDKKINEELAALEEKLKKEFVQQLKALKSELFNQENRSENLGRKK